MPRPVYRLASDTTSRRLASSRWFLARSPSREIQRRSRCMSRVELLLALLGRAQPLGGVEAGLDPLGELDLLLGVEQRDLADLLEVGADRVGGGGQLGVLAGLLERLGLLVVPLEVVGADSAASASAACASSGAAPRRRRPRSRRRAPRDRSRSALGRSRLALGLAGASPAPAALGGLLGGLGGAPWRPAVAVGGLRGRSPRPSSPSRRRPWRRGFAAARRPRRSSAAGGLLRRRAAAFLGGRPWRWSPWRRGWRLGRRRPGGGRCAESSTTTVTPASTRARRIFLAWAGVTSAASTVRATSADVSCPPAPAARGDQRVGERCGRRRRSGGLLSRMTFRRRCKRARPEQRPGESSWGRRGGEPRVAVGRR